MKLKGVRLLSRTYNGIFALTGEIRKVYDMIYGDLHSLPEELVDLSPEYGYYTVEGAKIDLDTWVDPVDWLPKGMLDKWKYAAMDRSGFWYLHKELPTVDDWSQTFSEAENGDLFGIAKLFEVYPDPLGWRQSLHARDEDGNWKRF